MERLQRQDVKNEIRVRRQMKTFCSISSCFFPQENVLRDSGNVAESIFLVLEDEEEERSNGSFLGRGERKPKMMQDIVEAYSRVFGTKSQPGK